MAYYTSTTRANLTIEETLGAEWFPQNEIS